LKEITARETENLLKENSSDAIILDVREKDEVAAGMIPGAKHLPLGELQTRMPELDKNTEYIIVCRSGNRSGLATHLLNAAGYNAVNMVGGMLDWQGPLK
jgi:rhodanese-related sulfurtransferase